jgi:hypothetical protein
MKSGKFSGKLSGRMKRISSINWEMSQNRQFSPDDREINISRGAGFEPKGIGGQNYNLISLKEFLENGVRPAD